MQYTHERETQQRKPVLVIPGPLPLRDEGLNGTMDAYLQSRGLDSVLAIANGWYPSRSAGDSEPRVVIPALSAFPGHWFWQARAIYGYSLTDANINVKRYQSPYGNRLDAVVVMAPGVSCRDKALLVEGPMCALAGAGEGYLSVALLGNTPSDMVVRHVASLLKPFAVSYIADSDAVPQAAHLTGRLAAAGVYVILKPCRGWKDLADVPRGSRALLLEQ